MLHRQLLLPVRVVSKTISFWQLKNVGQRSFVNSFLHLKIIDSLPIYVTLECFQLQFISSGNIKSFFNAVSVKNRYVHCFPQDMTNRENNVNEI